MSRSPTTSEVVAADWWDPSKKDDELVSELSTIFTTVRDESQWREDKDDYHWGLYQGESSGGLQVTSRKNLTYTNCQLPDNICKMSVDTLTARVATIRPIPQVLANRGNWKDQRRARKLRQLIQGEFFRQKIHERLSSRIIKDALVARGGVVQVFVDGKTPKVERVHPWTLFCDEWDAEFGEPLTMFRLRTMDRRKVLAKFGKNAELRQKIKEAGYFSSSTKWIRDEDRSSTVERVELLEAWYRCPDHDDDDEHHECVGRHVIITSNAVLFDEPWESASFPFAWLFYDTPNKGFFGSGLVETLEGYQVAIDYANERHDDALQHSGKMAILRDGGGIMKSELVNGVRVLQVRPGPYEPTVFDMDLVNEHMRMRVPELIERGLNSAGVSQMSAQAKKPAGIEAAVAFQTLDDIESQRHIVFGRRFEAWCMDITRLLIDCIKQIAKKHGDYAVKVPLKGAYLDLKWSDVKVDGFQLELQSVGQLYTSFTGRLDKLKSLFDMGAIDQFTFMRNLDAGDLQAELDLETVNQLQIDEILESLLDTKREVAANDNTDYIAPHKYMNLGWAQRRAHQKRTQAEMDGAPQAVLDLVTRFIDDVQYLEDQEKASAMTPDGGPVNPLAPPPGPPGGPMPPGGPGGGLPMDPSMLPMGVTPAGDQLMQPPPMPVAA